MHQCRISSNAPCMYLCNKDVKKKVKQSSPLRTVILPKPRIDLALKHLRLNVFQSCVVVLQHFLYPTYSVMLYYRLYMFLFSSPSYSSTAIFRENVIQSKEQYSKRQKPVTRFISVFRQLLVSVFRQLVDIDQCVQTAG